MTACCTPRHTLTVLQVRIELIFSIWNLLAAVSKTTLPALVSVTWLSAIFAYHKDSI